MQTKHPKVINLQNIQTAHAAPYQKSKQLNQKMGRRPKETFLQKKIYRKLLELISEYSKVTGYKINTEKYKSLILLIHNILKDA